MTELAQFARRFDSFRRSVTSIGETFLPQEQPRIQKITEQTVQAVVYDVYEPTIYDRTYNLKRSMRTYFPNGGNPRELWVDSDPEIAKAKYAEGGYPKFVAGEGPGIGFLKTSYGEGDAVRPSHFPREFHDAIYWILLKELPHRVEERIDKAIARL